MGDLPNLEKQTVSAFNGITPRDFQAKMLTAYLTHQSQIRKCLAIAVCGAGKTFFSAMVSHNFVQNGYRVVFIVDALTLPPQTLSAFKNLGLRVTVLHDAYDYDPFADVVITMMQTVDARLRSGVTLQRLFGDVGLWIFDEAHKQVKTKVFTRIEESQTVSNILGLTATPYRSKPSEYLGKWFDLAIEGPQPDDMIAHGLVLQERIKSVKLIEEEKLEIDSTGEYTDESQDVQIITNPSMDCILDTYLEQHKGVPSAFYCASVASAEALMNRAKERGLPFDLQTAKTPTRRTAKTPTDVLTRDEQLDRMESGDLWGLFTVGTLVEGFDRPWIGLVGTIRASRKHKAWWMQLCGRAARPLKQPLPNLYPNGKEFYWILDFGGNFDRFGAPSDYQDWYIGDKRKRKSDPESFKKVCPECGASVSPFIRVCSCGFVFSEESVNSPRLHKEAEFVMFERFSARLRKIVMEARSILYESFHAKEDPRSRIKQLSLEARLQLCNDWVLGAIFGMHPDPRYHRVYWEHLTQLGLPATIRSDLFFKEFGQFYDK